MVAVAGLATVAAGCGSSGTGDPVPATSVVLTPAEAEAALLRIDQLRPQYAFGYDLREVPVLDPADVSLIALYGPCGSLHKTSFLTEGAHRVFRSTISLLVEVVAQPGEEPATRLLDSLAAELVPGCAAFDEQVGGEVSTIELVDEVPLPALGDQRLAWSQQVTAPDGTVGYRVMVVLRDGGRLVVATVLLAAPIPPEAIAQLATTMALQAFGPDAVPADAPRPGGSAPGTLPAS